jgi:hypothetical protein
MTTATAIPTKKIAAIAVIDLKSRQGRISLVESGTTNGVCTNTGATSDRISGR